jgi:hypothetical protein
MNPFSIAAVALSVSLALTACNNADVNRTTSIPRGADSTALVKNEPTGLSAAPAPAERGPFVPDTGAPGAQSPAVFAADNKPLPNSSDDKLQVRAQEAAARAPDTASADEAKRAVLSEGAKSTTPANATPANATARDTPANAPRTGTLTPEEESNQMPKAGQVNNHSSTALEKDSGR